MRVTESCARCLFDKQKHLSDNEEYLKEIQDIIAHRGEDDTSPLPGLSVSGRLREIFRTPRALSGDQEKV